MAHGLRTIANKGYVPDGTGRDWFFLGDFDYRHGRLTPSPVSGKSRPLMTRPTKPRNLPTEVVYSKLCNSQKSTKEKWMRHHRSSSVNVDGAAAWRDSSPAAKTAPAESAFQATSWQLGRLPDWRGKRFDLPMANELMDAGVIGCEQISVPTAGPGDHTRGIQGNTPHFAASSWQVGQIPGWKEKKYELPRAKELERAGVLRSESAPDLPPTGPGDHSRGIGVGLPHHASTYSSQHSLPDWKQKDHGAPARHHFHSTSVQPDAARGGKDDSAAATMGDHSRGLKGTTPHFAPTSAQYGQDPTWKGKRYDFGPVASRQHRLTLWGGREG